MILSCTCKHEFQDKTYGKGMRVFNPSLKGYTCTVCGAKKSPPSGKKEEKKEAKKK